MRHSHRFGPNPVTLKRQSLSMLFVIAFRLEMAIASPSFASLFVLLFSQRTKYRKMAQTLSKLPDIIGKKNSFLKAGALGQPDREHLPGPPEDRDWCPLH